MKEHIWEIAICGTFDVQNYGDLLFPLIAEAELTLRLGPVNLHRFSYHAKFPPEWPYTVTSLTEFPDLAMNLDGVLIGGGFIIRFDKDVAPAYGPPIPEIHHPTGYWLTPALIALQHGIPLIWNAPGMHCNNIPQWAEPLMRLILQGSRHIRVRDQPSQETLKPFCNNPQITVIPDTAFGISRIVNNQQPSTQFRDLQDLSGLTGPYVIVQAACGLDSFIRFIQNHRPLFKSIRFLILPIGPVLGDHETIIGESISDAVHLPFWPHPLLLSELISHAEAVVGHSYHLAITALAFGVPVFSWADLSSGKYTCMSEFETIFPLPGGGEIDAHEFLLRLGKRPPSPAVQSALEQLDDHWDRIAKIINEGRVNTQPAFSRYLQSLPSLLEADTDHAEKYAGEYAAMLKETARQSEKYETEYAALLKAAAAQSETYKVQNAIHQRHIDELKSDLSLAESKITALYSSRSFRFTAPLRHILRRLNVHKDIRKADD